MALEKLNIPDIIAKARVRADLRDSNFLNDDEFKTLVQEAFEELYSDILDLKSGLYLTQIDELTPADNGRITLPEDFFKIRLLEQQYASGYIPLRQKSLAEASRLSGEFFHYYGGAVASGYVLFDKYIGIYPEQAAQSLKYRLSYGKSPDFENDQVRKPFSNYLVYQTAYIASVIEQNPNPGLLDLADKWRSSIINWVSVRDASPKVIKDTEGAFLT